MGRELGIGSAIKGLGSAIRPVALKLARVYMARYQFANLGARSLVRPPVRAITNARHIWIAQDVFIAQGAYLSVVTESRGRAYRPCLTIGAGTCIGADFVVSCAHSVRIGSKVLIADRVLIADSFHGYSDRTRPVIDQPLEVGGETSIGDGAFIGVNAVVLPGVRVGAHAVIGAGSVVTHDIPAFAVAAGNPARVLRIIGKHPQSSDAG